MSGRDDHRGWAEAITAIVAAPLRHGLPPGVAVIAVAFELGASFDPDVAMPWAPAAVAYNIAALRATRTRLLVLAPGYTLPIPQGALAGGRDGGAVVLGPVRTLRGGVFDLVGLARGASQVAGVVVDRDVFVEAGGLDETLAAAGEELPVAFADLVARLAEAGVEVRAERLARSGEGAGEAGLAAGRVLRSAAARRRRAAAVAGAIDVAVHSSVPAALKRVGLGTKRDLSGHALAGLAAGLLAGAPSRRVPAPAELPPAVRAVLREERIQELVAGDSSTPRRVDLDAIDGDGLPRLRVRIDHAPRPGQADALQGRERWRRSGTWQAAWAPRLVALEAYGASLITVESLHRPIAGRHAAHAFGEAARFVAGRREECERASIDDARLRALERAARVLGGEELGQLADEAVERLAAVPGLPEHGSLGIRNVLLCPGRTVLTGWERFAAGGLPGTDALALGIDALPPDADAADVLARRATIPQFEPLWTEIADLGLAELVDDVILLGLVTLAAAEREAAAMLVPARTAGHRITLEAWLRRYRARRTSVRGSVPAATLAANVSRLSPPST